MRSKDHTSLRIVDLWTFKSTKSNKRYIVEVEGFEHEFYGIKFYWKGVQKSNDRYSLLTNDYEPRTIVRSCIEVMLDYYRRDHLVAQRKFSGDKRKSWPNEIKNTFHQRLLLEML